MSSGRDQKPKRRHRGGPKKDLLEKSPQSRPPRPKGPQGKPKQRQRQKVSEGVKADEGFFGILDGEQGPTEKKQDEDVGQIKLDQGKVTGPHPVKGETKKKKT